MTFLTELGTVSYFLKKQNTRINQLKDLIRFSRLVITKRKMILFFFGGREGFVNMPGRTQLFLEKARHDTTLHMMCFSELTRRFKNAVCNLTARDEETLLPRGR